MAQAHSFATVDVRAPWLAHLSLDSLAEMPLADVLLGSLSLPPLSLADPSPAKLAALPAVRDATALLQALNVTAATRGVRTDSGTTLRFAPADDAGDCAYEAHIAATGRVPTRCSGAGALHDLFNALAWLALPHTNAALNARQAQQIARAGIGAVRGPVRDACTLLDESGLLLACADAATLHSVQQALQAHDWHALFVRQRADWHTRIIPVVLGHALLEKLARPYKAVTSQVVLLDCARDGTALAQIDDCAARLVRGEALSPRALAPLPVLGVPGWWPDNAAPAFYEDAQVFRPRPAARKRTSTAARHASADDARQATPAREEPAPTDANRQAHQ